MIKLVAPLLVTALLAGCSNDATDATSAPAETAPAAETAAPAAATDSNSSATADGTTAASASAIGTVDSVDADGGRIVIAHGPVEALQWPAMTMGFKATPEQIQTAQPGQRVEFEFRSEGSSYSLVRIGPVR